MVFKTKRFLVSKLFNIYNSHVKAKTVEAILINHIFNKISM